MKTKVSPAIVGVFVLGALILGLGALLMFGGVNFFSRPQRFVVSFDESVHGLDLGSPVKLRGVRIGHVVGLSVRFEQKTNRSAVRVLCELSSDVISDEKGARVDVSDRDELQRLVERGLRAQLGVLGLATGLLFVELNFLDPLEYPAGPKSAEGRYVVVPAVPSAISEFQANLTEILNDIRKVDFAGIGRELKQLLAETRRQLDGVDFKEVTTQWQKAGASVEALASDPEIREMAANLNGATAQLRDTLTKIDQVVGTSGPELQAVLTEAKATLETFHAAAANTRKFIAAQSGLGDEAGRAMRQLAEAAEAVQRLADFLERNPQALISGKKR